MTMATAAGWTVAAIRALGATTDMTTAAAVMGVSRGLAYDLHRRGELPFPVLHLGRRLVVPVAGLLEALGYAIEGPA